MLLICSFSKIFWILILFSLVRKNSSKMLLKAVTKHGKYGSRTYRSWNNMLTRCHNKNSKDYKNYGGRGIAVCDEWLEFENFYRDMGNKPLSLLSDFRMGLSASLGPQSRRRSVAGGFDKISGVPYNASTQKNRLSFGAEATRVGLQE